jgi:hypothetical protein
VCFLFAHWYIARDVTEFGVKLCHWRILNKGGPAALGLGKGLTKAKTWTYLLEQHDLVQSKDKWQYCGNELSGTGKFWELLV